MIRKSVKRFSEKIMPKQGAKAPLPTNLTHGALALLSDTELTKDDIQEVLDIHPAQ